MAKREFQLTEEQVQELRHAHAQCQDGPTISDRLSWPSMPSIKIPAHSDLS